jgi:hypothetical protein
VAIFDRPVRDAKPASWFGGSFDGAKKWLAAKGPDYFVEHATWVDEESEYYLAVTLDPERAASQLVAFTSCYPLKDPAVTAHLSQHQVVQVTGGLSGWITICGPPAEGPYCTIHASRAFPRELIAEMESKGWWLHNISYAPEDAPH